MHVHVANANYIVSASASAAADDATKCGRELKYKIIAWLKAHTHTPGTEIRQLSPQSFDLIKGLTAK